MVMSDVGGFFVSKMSHMTRTIELVEPRSSRFICELCARYDCKREMDPLFGTFYDIICIVMYSEVFNSNEVLFTTNCSNNSSVSTEIIFTVNMKTNFSFVIL